MKVCRWFGCLLVIAALSALVGPLFTHAGEKGKKDKDKKAQKLEWKAFDPEVNAEYYQTMTTETKQKMKVMEMVVDQNQNQTFWVKWTPKKKVKGNWVVTQKIIGVKMDIDIGGNKISFDSTPGDAPNNPMTDFFNALLKLDLTFTITKDMKVESIEGHDDFIKNLGKTNPQMEPLLKSILSKEALTKMIEPTLYVYPSGPVTKGETWKKTSTLDLGPIGTYKTDYTFDFEGKDKKEKEKERIGVKASMTYKLPFAIEKDSELSTAKNEPGTGYALFNPKLGRIDYYKMDMKLKGKLNIDIGGMKTPVELEQEQNATVTTSDTDPVKEIQKKKKS
jgi:hypothetical protein